jgi:hypothetical protein
LYHIVLFLGKPADIYGSMLEHFQDLQIRPQSQRHQILELLNGLMSKHRSAISSLADESLVGIVDLVSGEKDPRNLMMIFSILKVITVEWDIVKHAEVYFPIVRGTTQLLTYRRYCLMQSFATSP